ncbi:MAG: thioredoxin fold domain-containing protein [Pseudoxanthomonas sp.]
MSLFSKILLPALLAGGLSLAACAQQPAPAAASAAAASVPGDAGGRIGAALRQLNPDVRVDYVGPAPFPGFREVIAGGQIVYVSDDGRYLLQGNAYDMQDKRELTQGSPALAAYRSKLLAQIEPADSIVFAPASPKYTVTVFTDIECGYCRKLHSQIADYNKQGIAVRYLAFPRMGPASQDFKDMESVWCAADRRKALTEAKLTGKVQARTCTNPVAQEYDLGQRVGVNGTPAVFTSEGVMIGGYLDPAQMRAALDKLAAQKGAAGMP